MNIFILIIFTVGFPIFLNQLGKYLFIPTRKNILLIGYVLEMIIIYTRNLHEATGNFFPIVDALNGYFLEAMVISFLLILVGIYQLMLAKEKYGWKQKAQHS